MSNLKKLLMCVFVAFATDGDMELGTLDARVACGIVFEVLTKLLWRKGFRTKTDVLRFNEKSVTFLNLLFIISDSMEGSGIGENGDDHRLLLFQLFVNVIQHRFDFPKGIDSFYSLGHNYIMKIIR